MRSARCTYNSGMCPCQTAAHNGTDNDTRWKDRWTGQTIKAISQCQPELTHRVRLKERQGQMKTAMRARCKLAIALMPAMILACAGSALANQQPAHIYLALRALEQASPAVRAIVDPNLEAYLAGSTGPDIALTVFYARLAMGFAVAGEEAHYERTGQLINNMYDLASNDQERAFVLGWLTHWQADCIMHPLVNRFGGYYEHDPTRHKHLEMFECAHVFNKWAGSDPLNLYAINPAVVPAALINSAFAETYPPGWTTGRFSSAAQDYLPQTRTEGHHVPRLVTVPPAFLTALPGSAGNMQAVTQAFVDVHRSGSPSGIWARVSTWAADGPPPTTKDYEKLMDPLVIDKVVWEEPDRAAGETTGYITMSYTVNDIRIFKAFADAWDAARPLQISSIASRINGLAGDPSGYRIPDWNLDEGPGGFDASNRAHTWPGFPTIKDMLVQFRVTDDNGLPLPVMAPGGTTAWDPTGEWVPCPPAEPQTWGQWIGWSSQEGTKEEIWGGIAGTATLKIPLEVPEPKPLWAELSLAFADRADKSPYGIQATWSGPIGGEVPELSICFLVDCSGSMGGSKIREAIAAVKRGAAATNDGKTEWALVTFAACNARVKCQFTMDLPKIQAAADRLGAGGDTPLTYGIAEATTYLTTRGRGRFGRLIILADGEDNCGERGDKGPDEASGALRPMYIQTRDITMPDRDRSAGVGGGAR